MPQHHMTLQQLKLRSSRISGTLGSCAGVTCGCLLGLSVILLMDTEKAERPRLGWHKAKTSSNSTVYYPAVFKNDNKYHNGTRWVCVCAHCIL